MTAQEPWSHVPPATRKADGRQCRKKVPRSSHGAWVPPPDRPDPIALLKAQDADRQPDLVPVRWGRMAATPFTFYRGAAALMAADLAPLPRTGLTVQLCGDAHLSNFGLYGSPERELLFDVNDFDETHPGPFEWDIKRLATSFVIAARNDGFTEDVGRETALAAVRSYREHMAAYAEMRELDVWYSHVVADDLFSMVKAAKGTRVQAAAKIAVKARTRDSLQASAKMTEIVDGRRRIIEQPPLIMHFAEIEEAERAHHLFHQYARTLEDDRRVLVERYDVVDTARKVVGVGSVGTRCFIVLMRGRDDDDPLFLQVKEAERSVLEPYLGRSRFAHAGHRVVAGQRITQAASDIFLGWMTGPAGRQFYWRQLRDMKGSIDVDLLRPAGLEVYAEACGWALARGHARSGRRIAIAAYLGTGDRFDQAVADFAKSYADQAEIDHAKLLEAIKKGKLEAEAGV
jgi:uncharacterized protein (DUF2252 family)